MFLSKKASNTSESVTLKLNAKAVSLAEKGKKIYNLTAGQLPFPPMDLLVDLLKEETKNLKSFQYSPVAGFLDLRKKVIKHLEQSRNIDFNKVGVPFDCVISNGAKHSIFNILQAIIDPGDEVIMLTPYWISYPEMVRLCDGVPVIVPCQRENGLLPLLSDLEKAVSKKTKAIIVNSPNNPAGISYPEDWMSAFSEFLKIHKDLLVISDEIYFQLSYENSSPRYFYQDVPELLKRTIIVEGISKSLACTGLRIGYTVAPKIITDAISNIQGHTTSGSNSLVQRVLGRFDFEQIESFLKGIKDHLQKNAKIVRDTLEEFGLNSLIYRTDSAFYYMFDFSAAPCFSRFSKGEKGADFANEICEELLEKLGIAMVPGNDFGLSNSGRISLVLPHQEFTEAIRLLAKFLSQKD